MTSVLKFLLVTTFSAMTLVGCDAESFETAKSDIERNQTQTSVPVTTPIPNKLSCSDFDISIVNAEWAKKTAEQKPHRLKVTGKNGISKNHDLGIDRSPDFFFKIMSETLNDFAVIKGASRVLIYDCQSGKLQELGIILGDDFEGMDAQSGLVRSVSNQGGRSLDVDIVDYKMLTFTVDSDRRFAR